MSSDVLYETGEVLITCDGYGCREKFEFPAKAKKPNWTGIYNFAKQKGWAIYSKPHSYQGYFHFCPDCMDKLINGELMNVIGESSSL